MKGAENSLGEKLQALLAGVFFIVVLDQGSKFLIQFLVSQPIKITSFFQIVLSRNLGIAFGISLPYLPLLIFSSAVIACLIIYFLWFSRIFSSEALALLAVLGGGISNLAERIGAGSVRDFIAFSFWPSFNLADVAIVAGIILFGLVWIKKNIVSK